MTLATRPDLDDQVAAERQNLDLSPTALRRMRRRARKLFAPGHTVADAPADLQHHYHVGRCHVIGDAGEPLMLDWKATVSRLSYRADVGGPQGAAVRHRAGLAGGILTSLENDHLDRETSTDVLASRFVDLDHLYAPPFTAIASGNPADIFPASDNEAMVAAFCPVRTIAVPIVEAS
ncbi:hypothetical protein [Melissospora conviva]|uniref:hypothetical protein n=1 Tax=Melissospora conviva TaxID=3388432 RepID=UPI003C246F80